MWRLKFICVCVNVFLCTPKCYLLLIETASLLLRTRCPRGFDNYPMIDHIPPNYGKHKEIECYFLHTLVEEGLLDLDLLWSWRRHKITGVDVIGGGKGDVNSESKIRVLFAFVSERGMLRNGIGAEVRVIESWQNKHVDDLHYFTAHLDESSFEHQAHLPLRWVRQLTDQWLHVLQPSF